MPSDHSSLRLLAATVVLLTLATACRHEPVYPPLLVEADSLIVAGNRDSSSRLLDAYDQHYEGNMNSEKRKYNESAHRYRQLLDLELKYVAGSIGVEDFGLADTLCHYYKHHGHREQYAKCLLFRGYIFQQIDDHPSAIKNFLQAGTIGHKFDNPTLMQWIYSNTGDLYLKQRSFEECMPYYRKCYQLATANHDTLRISYAALRMGRLFTIVSNVDSTICYFQKALEMGRKAPTAIDIVPVSQSLLCDIYIQTEQFDKAAAIMPHDEMNDENWAYWHDGQQHTDSAAYYYRKMLGKYGPYADTQYLLRLAQLSEQQGNQRQALAYYHQYAAAEDSLKNYTQAEETRLAHAQYNVNSITQERDAMIRKNRMVTTALIIVLTIFALMTLIFVLTARYKKKKKQEELAHKILLQKEEEDKLRKSPTQIETNRQQIEELNKQLADAQNKYDEVQAQQIKLDTDVLQTENNHINALQRQQTALEEDFKRSQLYLNIIHHAGMSDFRLTKEEWALLAERIDVAYDHFTSRLLNLASLREDELQICYLVKIGIETSQIANMLCKTYNAVYMSRKRLYKKITREKESATAFDDFIRNF